MKIKVNITGYKRFLKKYSLFIVLSTIICGAAISGAAYFLTGREYVSESQLLVNLPQNEATTNADAIVANEGMINTYKQIIKSDEFLDLIAKDNKIDTSDLKDNIQIEQVENSYAFSVNVTDKSRKTVAALSKQISIQFKNTINQYVEVENVQILSSNIVSSDKSRLINLLRFAAIGLLTGFCLSMGFALIKENVIFE
ncbi:YveK family protein [Enterococcus alishanensis]